MIILVILFCISISALVISIIAFTKKSKHEKFNNLPNQLHAKSIKQALTVGRVRREAKLSAAGGWCDINGQGAPVKPGCMPPAYSCSASRGVGTWKQWCPQSPCCPCGADCTPCPFGLEISNGNAASSPLQLPGVIGRYVFTPQRFEEARVPQTDTKGKPSAAWSARGTVYSQTLEGDPSGTSGKYGTYIIYYLPMIVSNNITIDPDAFCVWPALYPAGPPNWNN